jgi:hypothetical protein
MTGEAAANKASAVARTVQLSFFIEFIDNTSVNHDILDLINISQQMTDRLNNKYY